MRFYIVILAAVASSTAMAANEDIFEVLLKRQAPGTPEYNCHDNCGTAITISKASSDVCKDSAFLTDYANCLQCAGPDNDDIWQYYGRSLSVVGKNCGLDTEPLSGQQPDVGPAVQAGGASSVSSIISSTSDAPSAAPTVTQTLSDPTPTTKPTVIVATTTSASGIPTSSTNATASFTQISPPQQTTNVASHLAISNVAGLLGLVLLSLTHGFGS